MRPSLEIEPRPHWWEASALTAAPTLPAPFQCGPGSTPVPGVIWELSLLLVLSLLWEVFLRVLRFSFAEGEVALRDVTSWRDVTWRFSLPTFYSYITLVINKLYLKASTYKHCDSKKSNITWLTDKRRHRAISTWLLNAARWSDVKPSSLGISMRPGYFSLIFCTALNKNKERENKIQACPFHAQDRNVHSPNWYHRFLCWVLYQDHTF